MRRCALIRGGGRGSAGTDRRPPDHWLSRRSRIIIADCDYTVTASPTCTISAPINVMRRRAGTRQPSVEINLYLFFFAGQ